MICDKFKICNTDNTFKLHNSRILLSWEGCVMEHEKIYQHVKGVITDLVRVPACINMTIVIRPTTLCLISCAHNDKAVAITKSGKDTYRVFCIKDQLRCNIATLTKTEYRQAYEIISAGITYTFNIRPESALDTHFKPNYVKTSLSYNLVIDWQKQWYMNMLPFLKRLGVVGWIVNPTDISHFITYCLDMLGDRCRTISTSDINSGKLANIITFECEFLILRLDYDDVKKMGSLYKFIAELKTCLPISVTVICDHPPDDIPNITVYCYQLEECGYVEHQQPIVNNNLHCTLDISDPSCQMDLPEYDWKMKNYKLSRVITAQ